MARQLVGGLILGLGLLFLGCDETVIRGDECTNDLNCAADWICASQRCVAPCLLDSDCAAVSPEAVCTFNHCLVPAEVLPDMQSLADAAVDANGDAAVDAASEDAAPVDAASEDAALDASSEDAAPADAASEDASTDMHVAEPDLAVTDADQPDATVDSGNDVDGALLDAEATDGETDAG